MKAVLSVAAVAFAFALTATPAAANSDPTKLGCTQVKDGQCVTWTELTAAQARRVRPGDVFGPNYPYYMSLSDLPEDMVREYDLEGKDRYIGTSNGYLFVVDPYSFKVTRVIAPEQSVR
jgi:hypothetical protein